MGELTWSSSTVVARDGALIVTVSDFDFFDCKFEEREREREREREGGREREREREREWEKCVIVWVNI